jgi:AraC family transcriptional regulator
MMVDIVTLHADISQESLAATESLPSRLLRCSLTAGWRSLLVRSFEDPAATEAFETAASPDLLIVLVTRGSYTIESFSNGIWRSADYRPGLGGMTACGRSSRLRWRALSSSPKESLHIHIPRDVLAATADEYRRAGAPHRKSAPDALLLADPLVTQIGSSLLEAMKAGASDLYAQSAAQFLATHLLSTHSHLTAVGGRERKAGQLEDRRLRRLLEYMRVHYAEPLTLDVLAREGGVSRFHFVHLFKNAVGYTPHQYIIRLRMQAAVELLAEMENGVLDVALACGYKNAAHFAAAFKRHVGCSPSEYRSRQPLPE